MKIERKLVYIPIIIIIIGFIIVTEDYNGSDYRIRISDHNNPAIDGYNGSGTIVVSQPHSDSYWRPGSVEVIIWTSTGNITNVDIDIYKGNILKYSLSGVSNNGSYIWTLNEGIETGGDWRIKISNSDDSSEYDWSEDFYISTTHADPIPGYNLIIIISAFCIISPLIIKKRFKNQK